MYPVDSLSLSFSQTPKDPISWSSARISNDESESAFTPFPLLDILYLRRPEYLHMSQPSQGLYIYPSYVVPCLFCSTCYTARLHSNHLDVRDETRTRVSILADLLLVHSVTRLLTICFALLITLLRYFHPGEIGTLSSGDSRHFASSGLVCPCLSALHGLTKDEDQQVIGHH
jgi:hypothetical protein